jgi:tRNA pseudouridine13 synthase
MQRFGTSTVPTHVTGLLILQSKWGAAIDSLLSLREGEHPDVTRARLAWLEDKDFAKALEIAPRRSVAERAVWEFYKRGGVITDKIGALANVSEFCDLRRCQIPRNLRTMYVHAYQSYIWNLVVSERIKMSATEPLVGDLVFDNDEQEAAALADEEARPSAPSARGQSGSLAFIKPCADKGRTSAQVGDDVIGRCQAVDRRGFTELHHL